MPSAVADRLDAAYRARIAALRSGAVQRVATEWGSLTIDELDAQFPGFVERAAKALETAQVNGVVATRAYIRGMARAEVQRAVELATRTAVAGTSQIGTIAEGLAPIRSMVFGKLGESKSADIAMEFGEHLVSRFTDNEFTRAVDTEMVAQATAPDSPVKGWVGTTHGATDECTTNGGFHTFDDEMVRHPGCKCDRSVAFDDEAGPVQSWPAPKTTKAGIKDATSAWTGVHYADLREFQMNGRIREGYSLADDPIHGISEARAAQAVSTLTKLIADGTPAPPLYRGLNVADDAYARLSSLKQGEQLDMALSSWSADATEASKFASRTTAETSRPVVIQVPDAQGFDMAKYGFYPQEKEWITNGRFVVEGVETVGDELVVSLRQEAVFDAPKSGIQ